MYKRQMSLKKYGISNKRQKELSGFCEQYPEWKQKLKDLESEIKGIQYTDMPMAHNNDSDTTSALAIKRSELSTKCELIEHIAEKAGGDMAEYLILNICYDVPVSHLLLQENMACSSQNFYDMRRYFFHLLDAERKM